MAPMDDETRATLGRVEDKVETLLEQMNAHRLASTAWVADIRQSQALTAAAAETLAEAVSGVLTELRDLIAELRKERSEREWNEVLAERARADAARAEPKKIGGKTVQEWAVLGFVLALAIIAALMGLNVAGLRPPPVL